MADQPDATLVSTRRFGNATVTLISEGTFPWTPELSAPEAAWRRAMSEADANGAITLGVNVAHIRLGDASILSIPASMIRRGRSLSHSWGWRVRQDVSPDCERSAWSLT